MTDPDIDDLLGIVKSKPKVSLDPLAEVRRIRAERRSVGGRGKAHKAIQPVVVDTEWERTLEGAKPGDDLPRFEAFRVPKGVTFLANVFGFNNSNEVRNRLIECPIVAQDDHGNPLYDFREACSYLVPRRDKDFVNELRRMRAVDLPPALSQAVQKAKNEELTYKIRAGELWHTEDVLEVLGETFLMMKDTMGLWVETLNETTELSQTQYDTMRDLVHGLQTELHNKLVELSKRKSTLAALHDDTDNAESDE
jgi:hypothetical protein